MDAYVYPHWSVGGSALGPHQQLAVKVFCALAATDIFVASACVARLQLLASGTAVETVSWPLALGARPLLMMQVRVRCQVSKLVLRLREQWVQCPFSSLVAQSYERSVEQQRGS